MKKKVILIFVLAVLFAISTHGEQKTQNSATQINTNQNLYQRWQADKPFVIAALCYFPVSYKDTGTLTSSGLNIVVPRYAKDVPVKKLAENKVPWMVFYNDWQSLDMVKKDFTIYGKDSGLVGCLITDEPNHMQLAETREKIDYVKLNYPGKLVVLPLFKDAPAKYLWGDDSNPDYTWQQYLDDFIDTKADVLMFNAYPCRSRGERFRPDSWFESISEFSHKCRQAGKSYWNWIQAFSLEDKTHDYRLPSESELRLLVYGTLAFGYNGIVYYTYDQLPAENGHGPSFIDANGVRNEPFFGYVSKLNVEIANLGCTLLNLKNTRVYFQADNIPKSCQAYSDAEFKPFELDDKGGRFIVSFFEDGEGNIYVMIVNYDTEAEGSASELKHAFSLLFDPAVSKIQEITRTTGQAITHALVYDKTSGKNKLDSSLPRGTGVLYKLNVPAEKKGRVAAGARVYTPPTAYVPKTQVAPVIDGCLNESCWAKTDSLKQFYSVGDGKTPVKGTELLLCCNDEYLYIAFRCMQEPSFIKCTQTLRDHPVWPDEHVELFLDIGPDFERYYQLWVNAENMVMDNYLQDTGWDAKWQSATIRTENGWHCEIAIPWAQISKGKIPELIGANFCRYNSKTNVASSWAGLASNFHQPSLFGLMVIGSDKPDCTVSIESTRSGDVTKLIASFENKTGKTKKMQATLLNENQVKAAGKGSQVSFSIDPCTSVKQLFNISKSAPGQEIFLLQAKDTKTSAKAVLKIPVTLSTIEAQDFGSFLFENNDCVAWWADATYKIAMNRAAPCKKSQTVRLSAAANEYEPVQIVIRPAEDVNNACLVVGDFIGSRGIISGENTSLAKVNYIYVTRPSDSFGSRGWYPDALELIEQHVNLRAKENNVFWLTVRVPKFAKAGLYKSKLMVKTPERIIAEIPIELQVWDFSLTDESHTEVVVQFGLDMSWHGLDEYIHAGSRGIVVPKGQYSLAGDWEKQRIDEFSDKAKQILELYIADAGRHRVNVLNSLDIYPIRYEIISSNTPGDEIIILDTNDFDKNAARVLTRYNQKLFNLGRFSIPPQLAGFKRFTPEYNKIHTKLFGKVYDHLKAAGIASKALSYWIDEPSHKNYDTVKKGMKLLAESCPGLPRLLTQNRDRSPLELFSNYVDIWVAKTVIFDAEASEKRRQKGENVWLYVCSGVNAPYPNLCLDHPAINPRVLFWMLERYNLDGFLYWDVTYWRHRNPWLDPMFYDGHAKPPYRADMPGTANNGDGSLLYPPVREKPDTIVTKGPIDSIRWEMIREGIEDREYFWLLKQKHTLLEQRMTTASGDDHEKIGSLLIEFERILAKPKQLVRNLQDYELDCQKYYEVRKAIAELIAKSNEILTEN
ncbi:MAG: glycoside hydrolase domain-containing protein [Planctomycetota bacterium]